MKLCVVKVTKGENTYLFPVVKNEYGEEYSIRVFDGGNPSTYGTRALCRDIIESGGEVIERGKNQ